MYSTTSHGRIIEYTPWEYTPQSIRNLLAIQEANAARVPRLLLEGVLTPAEVPEYIRTRGVTEAGLRALERRVEGTAGTLATNLRPGEIYVGRPAVVIFTLGTSAAQRQSQVLALWMDIELALQGS